MPPEYQGDFLALTDECFIKAVELRLQRLSPDQLEAAMKDADRSGFILVRPMVQQLLKFEKDEPAMSYYFSDLIDAIDVASGAKAFAEGRLSTRRKWRPAEGQSPLPQTQQDPTSTN